MERSKIINRKFLYIVLVFIIIAVTTLTMAYAILSVSLNIHGNAEVVGSNWNIHFANAVVKSGSVSNTLPTVTANKVTFSTVLNNPGDYYEFTVDIVNDGSIGAVIESVEKTMSLTEEETKFLKFDIEYENGDIIALRQTLSAGGSVTLRVNVSFRTDISTSDLPTKAVSLNLGFEVIYSQNNYYLISDSIGDSVNGTMHEAYVIALNNEYSVFPGMTLYDAINQKYDEVNAVSPNTMFPKADEFNVFSPDVSHVIIDERGKVLNLKKTIIKAGATYASTIYSSTASIDEDINFADGNYETVAIDVSNLLNTGGTVIGGTAIPVFMGKNDTYIDVIHAIFPNGYLFAPPQTIAAFQQDLIDGYALGFPAGQNTGCATTQEHRFFAMLDDNNNVLKITDDVNDLESAKVMFLTIGEDEMTYEDALAYVKAMIDEQVNGVF